jgi:hypothetical protein
MTKYLSSTTLTIVLLLALVVISILVLNHAFQSTMDRVEWQEETYKVKAGDSLWAISGDYCPDSVDRREWINEIQVLNGLKDSVVHPGQKLIVLAPAE